MLVARCAGGPSSLIDEVQHFSTIIGMGRSRSAYIGLVVGSEKFVTQAAPKV